MNKVKSLLHDAFVLTIIAAICGGSTPVSAKIALEAFPPFTLILIRSVFAILFLLPLILKRKELSFSNMKRYAGVSVMGALNPIILFIALQYTQASVSPLVYASVPAMTALYLYITTKKLIDKKHLLGIIMGFVGVLMIVLLPFLEGRVALTAVWGNVLIFFAAIAFMIYGLMSQRAQQKDAISPIALTFYFILYALIISIPFSVFEIYSGRLGESIGIVPIFHAIYIGVVGTGIVYVAYQQALKIGSAVAASLFTYLQPIVTISLASIFLGEQISFIFILGGVLAILGARLASGRT